MGAADGARDASPHSAGWSRIAERGSLAGIRFTAWCYRRLGRRLTQPLVYAVVTYFFLTDRAGRAASIAYLNRVHASGTSVAAPGRRPGWRESYRHYRSFADAIVDRLDVWFGGVDDFAFEQFGKEQIDRYTESGRGALILGAHLGSFDVLRGLARQSGVVVHVVMFTAHAERIQTVLRELSPEIEEHVITADPRSVKSVFAIRARLRRGEHVAILADRIEVGDRDRSVAVPLLGGLVRLPQAPILLAGLLGCPVVLLLALRSGPRGYRVYTELLAERVELPREGREAAVTGLLARYAQRLEHYIHLAPYQWFNFFDYWGDAAASRPERETR